MFDEEAIQHSLVEHLCQQDKNVEKAQDWTAGVAVLEPPVGTAAKKNIYIYIFKKILFWFMLIIYTGDTNSARKDALLEKTWVEQNFGEVPSNQLLEAEEALPTKRKIN